MLSFKTNLKKTKQNELSEGISRDDLYFSETGVRTPLFSFQSVESPFSFFWQDMRPLKAGRCQYYSSSGSYGYIYENFYTSVKRR